MLRFRCPECDGRMEAPEEYSERPIKCLACGEESMAPRSRDGVPPAESGLRFSVAKMLAAVTIIAVAITAIIVVGRVGRSAVQGFTKSVVTLAEYEQIVDGISYQDAVKIIGEKGTEMSRSSMPGIAGVMAPMTTVIYMWQNPNGSNMNATFQNNQLMMKAQFGLR